MFRNKKKKNNIENRSLKTTRTIRIECTYFCSFVNLTDIWRQVFFYSLLFFNFFNIQLINSQKQRFDVFYCFRGLLQENFWRWIYYCCSIGLVLNPDSRQPMNWNVSEKNVGIKMTQCDSFKSKTKDFYYFTLIFFLAKIKTTRNIFLQIDCISKIHHLDGFACFSLALRIYIFIIFFCVPLSGYRTCRRKKTHAST